MKAIKFVLKYWKLSRALLQEIEALELKIHRREFRINTLISRFNNAIKHNVLLSQENDTLHERLKQYIEEYKEIANE